MANKTRIPRKGPEIVTLFQRKAGPMAHRLDKRRKTRNKTQQVNDRIRED